MQTVHVRITDAATGQPTPARVHFSGPDGTYFPPLGRLATFPLEPGQDVGCHLAANSKPFAFVEGSFEINLPAGPVVVDIRKGPEYVSPLQTIHLKPGQLSLRLTLERQADPSREGWYAGDPDASGPSAHAALLEAAAEGLAVVNVLADLNEDGTRLTHVAEFSGQKPALERPGHVVVVNTRNAGGKLGQVNLLNSHRPVFPLRIGSGEGLAGYTLKDWCIQCHRKGGLVVWSDFDKCWPDDSGAETWGGEAMAALILGQIDAVQTTPRFLRQGEPNWFALLNCCVRVPLLGASGKASNAEPLGALRTYACLPDGEPFSYGGWIEAIRAGRVFLTSGPLLTFTVEGQVGGAIVNLPAGQKAVHVRARVQNPGVFGRLEVIRDGKIVGRGEKEFEGDVPVEKSGWLALRFGNSEIDAQEVFPSALASPVYVRVEGQPAKADPDSLQRVTRFLDGQTAWSENEATWENDRQRQHVLETLFSARQVLQQRI